MNHADEPGTAPDAAPDADPSTEPTNAPPADGAADAPDTSRPAADADRPAEIGGQKGPEPTRYGDWEKKGRCTDF